MKKKLLLSFALIIATFLNVNFAYGQLDSIHYLPPLTSENYGTAGLQEHRIYLSTAETSAFNVYVSSPDGTALDTLSVSNSTPRIFTPADEDNNVTFLSDVNVGSVQQGKGLIFASSGGQKFYVNYRVSSSNQAASLTSKGGKALGTRFRWGGCPNLGRRNSEIAAVLGILAMDSGTVVTISGYDPNCTFRNGNDDDGHTTDVMTINLEAGESYVLSANKNTSTSRIPNTQGWLGASIVSNKPIATANGMLLGGPLVNHNARDLGFDQPVPETTLGKEYILVRGNGVDTFTHSQGGVNYVTADPAEYGVVIATQNGTDIFINGNATPRATIDAGEYFIAAGINYVNNVMSIRGSDDIYVYQILSGGGHPQTMGMNFIPPISCLSPGSIDNIASIQHTDGSVIFTGGLNLLATVGATTTVTRNGSFPVSLPSAVSVPGNTDWEVYKISGLTGNISVASTEPILVGTFGSNSNAGFGGYFSGFDSLPGIRTSSSSSACLSGTGSVTLEEITGTFSNYQWKRNGVAISGATSSSYVATQHGNYSVEVTQGGCTFEASKFPVFYCSPEVVTSKYVNTSNVAEGDTVEFTISITSLGQDPITNVVVTDSLPAGLTFISATPNFGTWTAPNWTVGSMGSGQKATLKIVASLSVGSEGTTIVNEITHTQDQIDSDILPDDTTSFNYVEDDNDHDGIPDDIDLDDDNDGILDLDEGLVKINLVPNFAPTTSGSVKTWSNIGSYYGQSLDLQVAYISNRGLASNQYSMSNNTSVSLTNAHPKAGDYVIYEFRILDNATGNPVVIPEFDFTQGDIDGFTSGNQSRKEWEVIGFQSAKYDKITSSNLTNTGFYNGATTPGGYLMRRDASSNPSNIGNTSHDVRVHYKQKSSFRVLFGLTTFGGSGGNSNNYAVNRNYFFRNCNALFYADTDGDGILDKDDLDSDNDGCSDANEAGHSAGSNVDIVPGPYGANGFANSLETSNESGVANYTLVDNGSGTPKVIDSLSNECIPIAIDDFLTINEDASTLVIDIQGNDIENQGDSLITTIISGPTSGGTLVLLNTDSISYTPPADFYGMDTIVYFICDTFGLCDTAVVYINVLSDIDEDGVVDVYDLDDDNDGILDTEEASACSDLSGLTFTGSPNVQLGLFPDSLFAGATTSSWRSTYSDQTFDLPVHLEFRAQVSSQPVMVGLIPSLSPQVPNNWNDQGYKQYVKGTPFTDVRVKGSAAIANGSFAAGDLFEIDIDVLGNVTFKRGGVLVHSATGAVLSDYKLVISTAVTAGRGIYDVVITDSACLELDTDQDGIADVFDTDSDNDGCPDAIEGGASFAASQLVNDSLTGGVDLLGVPLVAVGGQDVGTSQDSTVNYCDIVRSLADDINATFVNTPVSGQVLTNDDDGGHGPLTTSSTPATLPSNGLLIINIDGTYTYTPNTGYTGIDSFEYEACDTFSPANCETAWVHITVDSMSNPDAANNNVIANPDFAVIQQGDTVNSSVLGNDDDPDGDILTVNTAPVVSPSNGTLTLSADGTYEYIPSETFIGKDTFSYEVCDNGTPQSCATEQVVITVEFDGNNEENDPPFAGDDFATTDNETPATGNLKDNDYDMDSDTITINTTPVSGPSNGTIVINPNGTYVYTPNPNFIGTEEVVYEVCDTASPVECKKATLYVTVSEAPGPDPKDDINATFVNTPVDGQVLTNDEENGNGPLVVNTSPATSPSNGTLTINTNGTYTYTPTTGFTGQDSFTYEVCDASSVCETAWVHITVDSMANPTAANNDLIANPDFALVQQGDTVNSSVLGNDSDPDGDMLTVNTTPVTSPSNGMLTLNTNGTFEYIPSALFTGNDTFTYEVCDNGSPQSCATEQVVVTVESDDNGTENDPPYAGDDFATTDNETPATGNLTDNDYDLDSDTITINTTPVSGPSNGTIVINPNGTYVYTPNPNFVGTEEVVYEVCDTATPVECKQATLYVTVSEGLITNPLVATVDNNTIFKDSTAVGNVLLNDNSSDPIVVTQIGGTPITSSGSTLATTRGGSITIDSTGSYTYTPATGFVGTDTIVYTVCTESIYMVVCQDEFLIINIEEIGDPSDTSSNSVIGNSDEIITFGDTATINLLANDYDPEGDSLDFKGIIDPVTGNPVNSGTITNIPGIDKEGNPVPNAGTIIVTPNGEVVFVPSPGFSGKIDSMTYEVCDNRNPIACTIEDLKITVVDSAGSVASGQDHMPYANNDFVATDKNSPVYGNYLANDGDPDDGDALQVNGVVLDPNGTASAVQTIATDEGGTMVMYSDGTFLYTPAIDFVGTDRVEYEICDTSTTIECTNATINLLVSPVVRDYSDLPNAWGVRYNRFLDAPGDKEAGVKPFWLGASVTDEGSPNQGGSGDGGDDGLIVPSTLDSNIANIYKVIVNSDSSGIKVFFKLSIDWDNDGTFDSSYMDFGITSSPDTVDVAVSVPSGFSGGTVTYSLVAQLDSGQLDNPVAQGGETEGFQVVTITPVPVTWLYFTAEKLNSNDVILDWSTASELNNSGFEVYKSLDKGASFEQIGFIEGQGTTTKVSKYQYVDSDANAMDVGRLCYRLNQVDYDGVSDMTKVECVDFDQTTQTVVYPNPATDVINVEFTQVAANATVEIRTIEGKLLESKDVKADEACIFDVASLESGVYMIIITDGGKTTSKRVIINH